MTRVWIWCFLGFFVKFQVCGFNFNTKNVLSINISSLNDSSYFGYSVLLQKGSESKVIVGAPRASVQTGGHVYACNLDGRCSAYINLVVNNENTFTGNFLGSVIKGSDRTGEEFVVCAPRKVSAKLNNNYLKGFCLFKRNSTRLDQYDLALNPLQNQRDIGITPDMSSSYYDFGFAEAGLDIHLMKESNKVLMGAPGVKTWSGTFVVQSLINVNDFRIFKTTPTYLEQHEYLGYSVTTAVNSQELTLYVIGAPRAKSLYGAVKIYEGAKLIGTLTGDEMGAYFGSVLLALDVNNDNVDEIFVGAPLGSGTTFDEGYVYFYKSNLESPFKLVGSKRPGARFGSSIVFLGDIDLDSYQDIAISAPYEDDGEGVVYVYLGGRNGIQQNFAQRLLPREFNRGKYLHVRGFGLGLSKGNDVDGNGHSDLAIGAYQSGQLFVVKGMSVIDFQLSLNTDEPSITKNALTVTYCIRYTQRSPTQDLKTVDFKVNLQVDYRAVGQRSYNDTWTVFLDKTYCHPVDLKIQQSIIDLEPFRLTFLADVVGDVIAKGDNHLEKLIPYVHGCGDDNICQTQISLTAIPEISKITLGYDKELNITVSADNEGETGYQCKLYITPSSGLELVDLSNCRSENETFICPFASRFTSTKEVIFKFSVSDDIEPIDTQLNVEFGIKCLGVNLVNGTTVTFLDVIMVNSPYIVGKSENENFLVDGDNAEDINVVHSFTVGNLGPSPIKLDVTLLMPVVQNGALDIFQFVVAEGTINGIQLQCSSEDKIKENSQTLYNIQSVITEPLNKTILLDCFTEGNECLKIVCIGDYGLYRSSEIGIYKLKFKVKAKSLVAKYKTELKNKVLAYVSSAFLFNTTTRVESHAATLFYYAEEKTIALWIYILASVLGLILLLLLIFLLYKCHFFDRTYREKMKDEKLMEQPIEIESEPEKTKDESSENDDVS